MSGLLSAWRDWQERRDILREMRRQQSDKSEQDRFIVRDKLTYALSALARDDLRHATELWTASLDHYPSETRSSPLALKVLLGLRRFDEAEALMQQGHKRHPREVDLVSGLAEVAQARGDHDAAIERWAALRKQFPGVLRGYVLGAEALMARNRLDEAETLAEQAIRRFPEEMTPYLEHARVAVQRQDWPLALQRWQPIRERFNFVGGHIGCAQAMIHLGRHDEADALLSEARIRWPIEPGPAAELARAAQARGNVPRALEHWKQLVQRFPLHMPSCLEAAASLEKLDAVAEAESVLRDAVHHFPTETRPLRDLGMLLHRRKDFTAAIEVWTTMRVTFPDNELAYTRGIEALGEAGHSAEAEALGQEHRRRFKSA